MNKIKPFLIELFEILNKDYNYAVLRSFDGLPDNFNSHDIDIIFDKNQYKKFQVDINKLISKYNLKLILLNESERFDTYILASYLDDKLEFLYLDFFFNYSLYGINLMNSSEILNRRKFNDKIYHVSSVDEFLEKYLNVRLLNQKYPQKYSHIKEKINNEYKNEVDSILNDIFESEIILDNIENFSGKDLLKKSFFTNMKKNPFSQLAFITSFYKNYFKSKLSPNGISMSFTGPDGSGKTTILEIVEKELGKVFREVKVNHFRPTVIPRIAEVFNKAGLKKEVDKDYSNPHRGGKTSKLSSFIRLFYYIFDYIYGYKKIVKPVLFRRGVVIFDRYYTDIVADSKRSRINIPYKIIMALKFLVPNMKYNFLVYVEPDNILARKQELTREQILGIYERLDYILDKDKSYTKIDNNKDVSIAVSNILNHIFENQHNKNIKRLWWNLSTS